LQDLSEKGLHSKAPGTLMEVLCCGAGGAAAEQQLLAEGCKNVLVSFMFYYGLSHTTKVVTGTACMSRCEC